jgi:Bacterial SH3 domain
MRMSCRMPGVVFLTVTAATMIGPVFAQQETPAAGPTLPDASGTGVKPQLVPAPQSAPPVTPPAAPPQAAPQAGSARSASVIARVNLRGGPSTDAMVITTIPAGTSVQVGDCTGEWCMVTWNGSSGFAIARSLNLSGTAQAKTRRAQPGYAGWRPPGYSGPSTVYAGPPAVYGAPAYYPPPAVVYGPGYYYDYYGPRYYYGWRRGW